MDNACDAHYGCSESAVVHGGVKGNRHVRKQGGDHDEEDSQPSCDSDTSTQRSRHTHKKGALLAFPCNHGVTLRWLVTNLKSDGGSDFQCMHDDAVCDVCGDYVKSLYTVPAC